MLLSRPSLPAVAFLGWCNGLSAKLIQLTAPGVPDVYQGSELWETSLVDPDNRRPVDFDARRAALAVLDAGELPEIDETGHAKLLVTSRALRGRVGPTYGYPGGGRRLLEAGALFAYERRPGQARVETMLALGLGYDLDALRALFASR